MWPPKQSLRGDIPGLRSDLKRCGGSEAAALDVYECRRTAFKLAVAYLGGTLTGHPTDGDRSAAERPMLRRSTSQ